MCASETASGESPALYNVLNYLLEMCTVMGIQLEMEIGRVHVITGVGIATLSLVPKFPLVHEIQ